MKLRNKLDITVIRANGSQEQLLPSFNSRTNVGAALVAYLLSNNNLAALFAPNFPLYIALSTNVLTPAAGDTTLSGETSATGLARQLGTVATYTGPASLDAGASYVLSAIFTNNSGGSLTINSTGIFDALASGNLFAEANLSSGQTLGISDQLLISWTINF